VRFTNIDIHKETTDMSGETKTAEIEEETKEIEKKEEEKNYIYCTCTVPVHTVYILNDV
jgi:hypothetical protein